MWSPMKLRNLKHFVTLLKDKHIITQKREVFDLTNDSKSHQDKYTDCKPHPKHKSKDCCCPDIENKNIFNPKIIINGNGGNGVVLAKRKFTTLSQLFAIRHYCLNVST